MFLQVGKCLITQVTGGIRMDDTSVFLQVGKCLIALVTGVFHIGDSFEEKFSWTVLLCSFRLENFLVHMLQVLFS